MDLTREEALVFFRMMWTDMQKKLGDNPSYCRRVSYKDKWVKENFPYRHVENDCFLCEYVMREGVDSCKHCPIDWGATTCQMHYIRGAVDWRYSPISKILALPERKDV